MKTKFLLAYANSPRRIFRLIVMLDMCAIFMSVFGLLHIYFALVFNLFSRIVNRFLSISTNGKRKCVCVRARAFVSICPSVYVSQQNTYINNFVVIDSYQNRQTLLGLFGNYCSSRHLNALCTIVLNFWIELCSNVTVKLENITPPVMCACVGSIHSMLINRNNST